MGGKHNSHDSQLLRGNTDLLILQVIRDMGSAHGYGIIKEMRTRSNGYFDFKDGTVYPALHRLERQGYLRGDWQNPSDGMNRRNYQITDKGKDVLRERTEAWRSFSAAMDLIFHDSFSNS